MDQHVLEDYLKQVYKLTREGRRATTTALSAALGLPAATVSKTLPRLSAMRMIEYDPYRGALLTESGTAVALEVLRHHRLLELFLHSALGMPLDEVHDEAERLEHVLSDAVEARLDALLGYPTLDPHGDPIPTPDLRLSDDRFPSLADSRPGDTLRIRRVSDTRPEVLRHLQARGIIPGATVRVVDHSPFEGLMRLDVDGREESLSLRIAETVTVEPNTEEEP
ncbi:MAG TPA: metal-dependent transcriptional regulator [Armatimonadota bacterium]|jgi:DtxR family Mn-dependent transcriptional regulator